MTGLGERAHLANRDIGLETHIQDVVAVLEYENLTDVVLVGKSYSGCVITAVADRVPGRLRRLVYLDAYILEDGQCLLDLVDPNAVPEIEQLVAKQGDGWLLPVTQGADDRRVGHPFKTLRDRLSSRGRDANVPRTYIHCTLNTDSDPFSKALGSSVEKARSNGWDMRELACHHMPETAMPLELAALIEDIADE